MLPWIPRTVPALLLLPLLWSPQPARAQAPDAAAQARAAIQRLREQHPRPAPAPPSREETASTVVTFCTQVGDTAALVAEARQQGMSVSTTLLFFRATAKDEAKTFVTHLVTKALLLTDASSPTQARDYITAHCLDNPMFWTGPTSTSLY